MSSKTGIDPRGPRFGATITAVLLLIDFVFTLPLATVETDLQSFGYLLMVFISAIFIYGAIAGIADHPYGYIFRWLILPRLKKSDVLENPAGPTFAQWVGFIVTILGILLYILGFSIALPIAAGLAFVAAFLNSAFGFCLGCQIYLFFAKRGVTFGLEPKPKKNKPAMKHAKSAKTDPSI